MIYLAVFNVPVLHSATSPLGFKGRVGRRGQEGGSREDNQERRGGSSVRRLSERFRLEFGDKENLLPQNVCLCQKKAVLICWLVNEPPSRKDGRGSSQKQYFTWAFHDLVCFLPFLQTQ
jgi:hypothetical protein